MRIHHWILWLLLTLLPVSVQGIYRCETPSGVEFSDQPCGDNAQRIELDDNRIGGQFDSNLPAPRPAQPPSTSGPEEADNVSQAPCRFISSTNLRTYLVRNQVVTGMTKAQVLKAFGRPPETYPVPQETWIYQTDYYGKLYELTYVYFRNGCVESVQYRKP
ncbi:outer membrane protein assembly factor BamE domain-containing protein [Marinobacter caseinilyticus]|uniref:outer membrane protein assembly factor BamE domain-containing protein n=1 Tax=Marinobacter caseinilyticus TaxID=2692195 RepID=UPI00140C8341|nr:outer membrane protein assembly factor BamE [Marinobacter caseinilyticus]